MTSRVEAGACRSPSRVPTRRRENQSNDQRCHRKKAGLRRRTIPVTPSVNPPLKEDLVGDWEVMLSETPSRAHKKPETIRRGGKPCNIVKIPGEKEGKSGGVGEHSGIAEYMSS